MIELWNTWEKTHLLTHVQRIQSEKVEFLMPRRIHFHYGFDKWSVTLRIPRNPSCYAVRRPKQAFPRTRPIGHYMLPKPFPKTKRPMNFGRLTEDVSGCHKRLSIWLPEISRILVHLWDLGTEINFKSLWTLERWSSNPENSAPYKQWP